MFNNFIIAARSLTDFFCIDIVLPVPIRMKRRNKNRKLENCVFLHLTLNTVSMSKHDMTNHLKIKIHTKYSKNEKNAFQINKTVICVKFRY